MTRHAVSLANLLVDADRDGRITPADDVHENVHSGGPGARGMIVLPNFDRNNTSSAAPTTGPAGRGTPRPLAPNTVIDDDPDLLDVGKLRLARLSVDDPYKCRATSRRLRAPEQPDDEHDQEYRDDGAAADVNVVGENRNE